MNHLRTMSTEALEWSINDARLARDYAEEMVRAGMRANPGKYSDQIAEMRAEQARRATRKVCPTCAN